VGFLISEFDAFAQPLDMVDVDLSESNRTARAWGRKWLFIGLAGFALIIGGIVAWDTYVEIRTTGLDPPHIVTAVLFSFIIGMFLFMDAIGRAPATRLIVDSESIQLTYQRGPPYVPRWSDPDLIIRGRWNQGVRDSTSRGKPTFSIYGRQSGFTESFIPEAAYRELFAQSASRRLILADVRKGADWTLWSISPANT
jgi:hypothetical protein